ncbi:MAG: heme ABC exporter ATP-binding protein CcmA [Chloroflexi bacterium UTCFX4]|jgi:heme exporter protein A|nr:MAG: heme ABC exporter ATP-binding protein CcmA [Chloroflexi bacterium UTCFX4]
MIETLKLEKTFGYKLALKNTTLTIEPGQIVALAGPNGAGKSTLLRILATLARPTRGRAAVNGIEIPQGAMQARASIGYVGHQTLLYDELSVAENLRYYARLYALDNADARILQVAKQVGIEKRLSDTARTLSRGYQQRVALARALLHRPKVYLYDEPWTGLDQSSSHLLSAIFAEARQAGAAVLFSSHEFERSLAAADRALIMRNGKIIYDGLRAEWRDASGFAQVYTTELARAQEHTQNEKRAASGSKRKI